MRAPEWSGSGALEYLGALNALLLNEQATLFRRKYYVNGAHMGFILFTSGADLSDEDIAGLRETLSEPKGSGNFKSLYLHFDSEGQVELKPVGDFAKDDFEKTRYAAFAALATVRDGGGALKAPDRIAQLLRDNETVVRTARSVAAGFRSGPDQAPISGLAGPGVPFRRSAAFPPAVGMPAMPDVPQRVRQSPPGRGSPAGSARQEPCPISGPLHAKRAGACAVFRALRPDSTANRGKPRSASTGAQRLREPHRLLRRCGPLGSAPQGHTRPRKLLTCLSRDQRRSVG